MALVLVVDDDRLFREMTVEILESRGLSAVEASDGFTALQRLEDGLEPDYIILDIQMPRMNGLTFLDRKECSRWFAIPVFVCSSETDQSIQNLLGKVIGLYKKDEIGEIIAEIVERCSRIKSDND